MNKSITSFIISAIVMIGMFILVLNYTGAEHTKVPEDTFAGMFETIYNDGLESLVYDTETKIVYIEHDFLTKNYGLSPYYIYDKEVDAISMARYVDGEIIPVRFE